MVRYPIALVFTLLINLSAMAVVAGSVVQTIDIKSAWSGLGEPENTELVISNERGTYRLGRKRISPALIDALVSALEETPIDHPSLESLGITRSWLEHQIDSKAARSSWSMFWEANRKQKALFWRSYTDPQLVSKVLPSLFSYGSIDNYPSVQVTIVRGDGSVVTAVSNSCYQFMMPWTISVNGKTASTFNQRISLAIAPFLPSNAINRSILSGRAFAYDLAHAVRREIENDWKVLGTGDQKP